MNIVESIKDKGLEKFNSSNIGLDTLKSELQYIIAGGYIDGKLNIEKENLAEDIKGQKEKLIRKEKEIEDCQKEIKNIQRGKKTDLESSIRNEKVELFNPTKFYLALSVWIICFVVLVIFYIPVSWKAWIATTADIARLVADGIGGGTFPSTYEFQIALQNYYSIFFPFIPMIFGVGFHFSLQIKKKAPRIIWSAVVIGMVFFIDFAMAIGIHNKTNLASQYAGFPSHGHWLTNQTFYLILACGFGVAAMWGWFLHIFLVENEKRSPVRQLHKILKQLNAECSSIKKQINFLEDKRMSYPNVSVSSIELFEQVKDFRKGWFEGYSHLKKSYEDCFNNLIKEHFSLTTNDISIER